MGTGACTKSTEYMHSIPWSEKVPALPETAGPDNNMCPDQKTSCDSGTTCCKMSSGGYGCCPYEKVSSSCWTDFSPLPYFVGVGDYSHARVCLSHLRHPNKTFGNFFIFCLNNITNKMEICCWFLEIVLKYKMLETTKLKIVSSQLVS